MEMKAFSLGFSFSMHARQSLVSSSEEVVRLASAAAASVSVQSSGSAAAVRAAAAALAPTINARREIRDSGIHHSASHEFGDLSARTLQLRHERFRPAQIHAEERTGDAQRGDHLSSGTVDRRADAAAFHLIFLIVERPALLAHLL